MAELILVSFFSRQKKNDFFEPYLIFFEKNIALLDNVRIRIENAHFSIKDLAQVTVRDPQTLLVTVHDPDVSSKSKKYVKRKI